MTRWALRPLWSSILLVALVAGAVGGCAGEQEDNGQQQQQDGEDGGEDNGEDGGGMYGASAPGSLTVAGFDSHRIVLVR